MDISRLTLNPDRVRSTLKVMPDKSLVTLTGCRIYVPESFRGHNLLSMGVEIMVMGYLAIVLDDGSYSRTMTPNFFVTSPTDIGTIDIEGTSYYEFIYAKNTTVFKNTSLFKDDIVIYDIFDEFLAMGKIPWYYDYESMGLLYRNFKEKAGRQLVPSHSIGEMFIASITRSSKDRTVAYRQTLKGNKEIKRTDYTFVPLRNVQYGTNDTLSRIAGSYSSTDGFDSALVNPTEESKPIESLLRT